MEEEPIAPSAPLERRWTLVDRELPDMASFAPSRDWTQCRGETPCVSLTWSPVDLTAPRPTLTLLRTPNRLLQTAPESARWRLQWTWLDPVLTACLGSAIDIDIPGIGVSRDLVERQGRFWWQFDFQSVGPCEISGGLELGADRDKGVLHSLTSNGHPWGSPEAHQFSQGALKSALGDASDAAQAGP